MKADLYAGNSTQMSRTVTEETVIEMARISGDHNPIHLDETYAKTTRFHGRIAHGLFCISMISAIMGNELPGPGTIIVSEKFDFKRPAYIGDEITASVTIEQLQGKHAILSFICKNQCNEDILTGSADVVIDSI